MLIKWVCEMFIKCPFVFLGGYTQGLSPSRLPLGWTIPGQTGQGGHIDISPWDPAGATVPALPPVPSAVSNHGERRKPLHGSPTGPPVSRSKVTVDCIRCCWRPEGSSTAAPAQELAAWFGVSSTFATALFSATWRTEWLKGRTEMNKN